jgi:hypothetical protein
VDADFEYEGQRAAKRGAVGADGAAIRARFGIRTADPRATSAAASMSSESQVASRCPSPAASLAAAALQRGGRASSCLLSGCAAGKRQCPACCQRCPPPPPPPSCRKRFRLGRAACALPACPAT